MEQVNTNYLTSTSLINIIRPQVSGGKITLPVSQYSIYAQFKHIETVPAGPGSPGFSVSKVRVLDTLIDRLVRMKQSRADFPGLEELQGRSDEALDALINEYSQKIKMTMNSGVAGLQQSFGTTFAGAQLPGSLSPAPSAAVLNLTA